MRVHCQQPKLLCTATAADDQQTNFSWTSLQMCAGRRRQIQAQDLVSVSVKSHG
jgi:hypothetical protein